MVQILFSENHYWHNLSFYGYYSLQTKQELMEAYNKAEALKKKIIAGFYKFIEVSSDTVPF